MIAAAVLWVVARAVPLLAATVTALCTWAVAVRLVDVAARLVDAITAAACTATVVVVPLLAAPIVRDGLHVARAGHGAMHGTPDPFGLPRRPRP